MNVETYDEGMETEKKSQDYSVPHGNVGRHRHNHRNVGRHRNVGTNIKAQDTRHGDYSSTHGNVGKHRHRNGNVATYIEGMKSDTRYGDYSSGRWSSGCTVTLICNTTGRIKPGSCHFT